MMGDPLLRNLGRAAAVFGLLSAGAIGATAFNAPQGAPSVVAAASTPLVAPTPSAAAVRVLDAAAPELVRTTRQAPPHPSVAPATARPTAAPTSRPAALGHDAHHSPAATSVPHRATTAPHHATATPAYRGWDDGCRDEHAGHGGHR